MTSSRVSHIEGIKHDSCWLLTVYVGACTDILPNHADVCILQVDTNTLHYIDPASQRAARANMMYRVQVGGSIEGGMSLANLNPFWSHTKFMIHKEIFITYGPILRNYSLVA